MILEFDLGNSRCKWRLRDRREIILRGAMLNKDSFDQLESQLADVRNKIKEVRVASVVGFDRENALIRWSEAFFGVTPMFARTNASCGRVRNGYTDPARLGVDRWLGIIAGYQHTQGNFIVVSFGTAITVDLVIKDGGHAGGFIAPGIALMLDSLRQKTHQVKPGECPSIFDLSPGRSTVDAVNSAVVAMLLGLIENGLEQLRELAPDEELAIIFTGGDARRILPFYPQAQHLQDLVLDGLAYIFDNPK